ncbi:DNA glycosylase [Penicillium canescens]|uniref:DNA glycosylase n=1 Tax=Penicillium canescens TaxID=5083 RepID=A0AAD6IGP8_PENCN|nr:DNA glycosylase [Penicillium canescens]KAJ6004301.1 DNA glycosylase [Penicillium canescens]KAJ6029225.1 DNA glycosylase [Penicillium canescens]KAJ6047656.1 DNA glycosylase [Penicillium canescens]KAJ6048748.1 DNA glycosylase [Penicillium canescens]KAJ6100741.1 DNA glycosylase [Penicillium canescens]
MSRPPLSTRASLRHSKRAFEPKSPVATFTAETRPSKKWVQYERFATWTAFPDHYRPSTNECKLAHDTLAALHGDRDPAAANAMNADGFDPPSTFSDPLDGLVYAVLCQATNERNAIRQVLGQIIKPLSTVARPNFGMCFPVKTEHDLYSLNHLGSLEDEEGMKVLLSYNGVGPKTASCVLAMTLQRQKFVVDTHIYRITGRLGWRPMQATAEEARAHLETRIPDEHKYALHLLFITHGRECPHCKAGKTKNDHCPFQKKMRDLRDQ